MMKCVEQLSGIGDLLHKGTVVRQVRFQVSRFQAFAEGSGLPIPGLHRIEGSIDFDLNNDPEEWIGDALGLRLADGRILAITLADKTGRILNQGHGPTRCLCC
jgi:hypothetical protein